MTEITSQDLADLVNAANSLVETFDNKESEIDSKITAFVNEANSKLVGGFSSNDIYVDSIAGDDTNIGSREYPLKTLNTAFTKTSPLFRKNRIMLESDQTYAITNSIDAQESTNIEIYGYNANYYKDIRTGAEDNRPTIRLDIDVTPNDGLPIDSSQNRHGIYPARGLNIMFNHVHYAAPQGFENDTDKPQYGWGPYLIMWQDSYFPVQAIFKGCRIEYGLGGIMAMVNVSDFNIGLSSCDLYFNPAAANFMCRHFVRRGPNTRVSISINDVYAYNNQSGLELSGTEMLESIFSHHWFSSADAGAHSRGIFSTAIFSRESMGMI